MVVFKHSESQIQKACVRWFRLQYPQIEGLFFAVPNGGLREAWTARIMHDEGVRAGVADLILLMPSSGYAALAIEMKTPKGRQSEEQKKFQMLCESHKVKYCVCRSFDEFRWVIVSYLSIGQSDGMDKVK